MGGKCSPSGGITKMFGGTRIKQKDGVPNSRIDLYPDESHQGPEDLITSRWFDDEGWAMWQRDYTDHNLPDAHPIVPHDHPWRWQRQRQGQQMLNILARQNEGIEPSPDFC